MQQIGLVLTLLALVATPVSGADLSGSAQASGKPVQYAVVWLDAPQAPPLVKEAPVTIDQRNLAFSPHVLVIRVGTMVAFPNSDHVFHNVFSFKDGKKFDLGMYPTGTAKPVVFDKPGLSRIFCNIHPNMAAYVMAVDTPYYAMSNEQGGFTLPNVPPGTYTYHAWRPGGETLTGSITIGSTKTLDVKW
ncbi:MAG: carboxypeptidase regulatory-like domain-containing protein [Vicinamibacterales bacterium]|nr:carboxypeptidase regulatory-like domain-containing protein [Vicinamibacterales bacterium]